MRADLQTLFEELLKSSGIEEDDMITGAVIVVRCKDMETGVSSVAIGQTDDCDGVVKLGLLHAAIEIQQQEEWRRPS